MIYGLNTISEMIRFADGAIEILPGGGISLRNADQIIQATGCTQVHLARHRKLVDPSTANNREIYFGGALYPPEDTFDQIDGAYVVNMRTLLP